MKRFQFKLDPLLRFLSQKERKQLGILAPFLTKFNGFVEDYKVTQQNLNEWHRQKQTGFSMIGAAQTSALNFRLVAIKKDQAELTEKMRPIREELLEIRKKKKGLELLRESQYKKWSKECAKEDFQNKEDVFHMQRFLKKSIVLGD